MKMKYEDIIVNDLSADDIKEIIKDISDGKKQYSKCAYREKLRYHNGRYITIWDYIFTNIENSFKDKSGFKCFSVERCALWNFAVIYKEDTNVLYLILKEKRFKELKNDNNLYHYVKIFNSKNCCLYKQRPEQINCFRELGLEEDVTNDIYIDEDLENMIGEIKDKVKNCVNILFREGKDGINRISANIATQDLEIVATQDWSEYITADIEEIIDTNNTYIEHKNIELPEIPLNIRKEKIIKKEENTKKDLVKQRKGKIKKEETKEE